MKNEFSTIDQLGILKAQIGDLESRANDLIEAVKHEMFALGVNKIDGVLWTATLVVGERSCVNTLMVQEEFPRAENPELYKNTVTEALRITARQS